MHLFSFLSTWNNSNKLGILYSNLYERFLRPTMWYFSFCFMFFILRFGILILLRQPRKMVKHTQTIRQQKPTNCMSLFDHFVGLAPKGLIVGENNLSWSCLQAFSHLPMQTIQVGKTFDGKVWLSVCNTWFCACENRFYIIGTIMAKHDNIFCLTYYNSLF